MRTATKINMSQAATLLEQSETISVTSVDGATATTIKNQHGQSVLVQGSGEDFLHIQ